MIYSKERVLLAVARHAGSGREAAIEQAARDLCIPVELVLEAIGLEGEDA